MAGDSVERWRKSIVEVNCTLDEEYSIVMGDESFYQLVGLYEMYPFDRLVYPEQRQDFKNFMNNQTLKTLITRCKLGDDFYRWVLIWKVPGEKVSGDKTLTELKLQDMIGLSVKYEQFYKKIKKYRAVLNILQKNCLNMTFKRACSQFIII